MTTTQVVPFRAKVSSIWVHGPLGKPQVGLNCWSLSRQRFKEIEAMRRARSLACRVFGCLGFRVLGFISSGLGFCRLGAIVQVCAKSARTSHKTKIFWAVSFLTCPVCRSVGRVALQHQILGRIAFEMQIPAGSKFVLCEDDRRTAHVNSTHTTRNSAAGMSIAIQS